MNNVMKRVGAISTVTALGVTTLTGCGAYRAPKKSNEPFMTPSAERMDTAVEKPNIVYIVLDDMGYSDLGCYGSSIRTPNIDQLAREGVLYTDYYTQPMSSASRAAILTGCDSNAVGMGIIADDDMGPDTPNIRGMVYPEYATAAENLAANGYSTIAVGKWHLGSITEYTPDGDREHWPSGKGFQKYFTFQGSQVNQMMPGSFISDNRFVETDFSATDYHLTTELVDRSLGFIDASKKERPEAPFFLYFCTGALHGPLQAPKSYIQQYKGMFDDGWDVEREKRLAKQIADGLLPQGTQLPQRNEGIKAWEELSPTQQQVAARHMEIYAAMLTHTDEEIGRLLQELKARGEYERTTFVLLSDNGANASGSTDGSPMSHMNENYITMTSEEQVKHLEEMGGALWGTEYNNGWAMASSTPFRYNKTCAYNGGVRVPLVVAGANVCEAGRLCHDMVDSTDITPTMLDMLNLGQLTQLDGLQLKPMTGKSFLASLQSPQPMGRDKVVCMILGNSFLYNNGEYAIARRAGAPTQLFSVKDDPTQIHDLRADHEQTYKDLKKEYDSKKRANNAENIATDGSQGEGTLTLLGRYGITALDVGIAQALGTNGISSSAKSIVGVLRASNYDFGAGYKGGGITNYYAPGTKKALREHTYDPAAGMFYSEAFAQTQLVSHTITQTIGTSQKPEGVIFARGGLEGGYAFYVKDQKLVFEYNFCGDSYQLVSDMDIPANSQVKIQYEYLKKDVWNGEGVLRINDQEVARGPMKNLPTFVSFDYVSFGCDAGSLVSKEYERSFQWNGTLGQMQVHLGEDMWENAG